MFNVIRIPTKFSRTIKRFSQKEKAELLTALISIGDGEKINIPDNQLGDTIQLIYGEWMNMEKKNGNKSNNSLIGYSSELPGQDNASYPDTRVEYNRVEDSIIEDNIKLSEDNTTEVVKVDKSDEGINELLFLIKREVENQGKIYKAGKNERQRAHNILTGKDYGEVCERAGMDRIQFTLNILKVSDKLDIWRKIVNNAETIYKHYAQVYNSAVTMKEEKKSKNIDTTPILYTNEI